jgi:PAS domain-containing protein
MDAPRNGQPEWEAELFRLLIDNSTDDAVFVVGLDGRVLTWNPGAERVLGYRESEIVGKSSFVLFTPEDQVAGIPEAHCTAAKFMLRVRVLAVVAPSLSNFP